jgi:hypothetical protein
VVRRSFGHLEPGTDAGKLVFQKLGIHVSKGGSQRRMGSRDFGNKERSYGLRPAFLIG